MDEVSSTITGVFIFFIMWMTFAGFWPFLKAFGLSGLFSFWKASEHLKKEITEAIRRLPAESLTERQRQEFARKYNTIDDYFKKDQSGFSHLWLEFTEQLIKPSGKEHAFQNSIRPEKFFTWEYFLKQKDLNLKLLESMPGILVGMGVLGTFVGLSVSLIPALDQLQGSPSEAVEILISGAGVAFFTSVFGLAFSLIFNVVSDKKISGLQIQLNRFNSLLEKSLKFVTEEHLLVKSLEELQQQGKYLENMDENIALKIGDRIEKSFERMSGKMQQVIEQSNQNISEKFLDNMANQMTKGMGDFSRKQMENMEKILTSLQENIPPLISRLENSQKQNEETTKALIKQLGEAGRSNQDQINKSLTHAIQDMKNTFAEITQNLKEEMTLTLSYSVKELQDLLSNVSKKNKELLQQTGESQSALQKNMNQTAEKLHAFTDRLRKIISELSETAAPNIKSAVEKFNEAAEQQEKIVEKNERYIQALDNLSEEIKEMSSSMSETMEKKLPRFIEQIDQSNKFLQETWSSYEKRFSDVDESAKKLFENISEGLNSVSKRSAEYIHNLYKQSSQVSSHFAGAVEELRETVSELSEAVDKLKK